MHENSGVGGKTKIPRRRKKVIFQNKLINIQYIFMKNAFSTYAQKMQILDI